MDLKQFVAQTLTEIAEGVRDARIAVAASGAMIAPKMTADAPIKDSAILGKTADSYLLVHAVSFDVAVEASSKIEGGGKISVLGGIIGGGAEASTRQAESVASRIRFVVPITYSPAG